MKLLLLLFMLLLAGSGKSQDSSTIFIPAGQSLSDVVSIDRIYRYPKFTQGKIYFKDGTVTAANLNYNFLNGEIEFIAPKGDTLAIAKDLMLNIKIIAIDSNFFYYNDGYFEEIEENNTGKLLKREQYRVKRREKIGGYDQPTSTSAISTYSNFTFGNGSSGRQNKLVVKETITLVKVTEYFFADQYNSFLRASKKNIIKVYPKMKDQIEAYLLKNNVDFNNGKDVQKLFASLQSA